MLSGTTPLPPPLEQQAWLVAAREAEHTTGTLEELAWLHRCTADEYSLDGPRLMEAFHRRVATICASRFALPPTWTPAEES